MHQCINVRYHHNDYITALKLVIWHPENLITDRTFLRTNDMQVKGEKFRSTSEGIEIF